jgi:hypothetical protein
MHQAQPLQLVLLQETEAEPLPPDLVKNLVDAAFNDSSRWCARVMSASFSALKHPGWRETVAIGTI